MIINLLINFLLLAFGTIFTFFPEVSIDSIPFVGQFIYDALVFAMLKWNAFMVTFPYAQTGWYIFIYGIIPFEITLLLLKFFFGHRAPINNVN